MTQTHTITLPLPDTNKLSQNKNRSRGKDVVVKTMRARAMAEAVAARFPRMQRASLLYRFYFPNRCARDESNYIHGCKPYLDGVVDAGVLRDDCWTYLSTGGVESVVDKSDPRVELVFTPSVIDTDNQQETEHGD